MTSKYHGLPPEKLERLIKDRYGLINLYSSALNERLLLGRDVGVLPKEIALLKEGLAEMEAALKPKIDYEDGTWV
jgi:hypothetical protein